MQSRLLFTLRVCAVCLFPFALAACNPLYWVGIRFLYDEVPLPAAQIVRDIPYDPSAPDDAKRQLDLFTPAGKDWPIVVFIHGGNWDTGDRGLKIGGADIYGNIGRMLASHGFGAAVISYRLLDARIDWQLQVRDVARAVAWVQQNATKRGGRAKSVFLMGHSAGAQLAMRLAADPTWLAEAGGDSSELCGVVGVSGAAYDLDDPETLALETEPQVLPTEICARRRQQDVEARCVTHPLARLGRPAVSSAVCRGRLQVAHSPVTARGPTSAETGHRRRPGARPRHESRSYCLEAQSADRCGRRIDPEVFAQHPMPTQSRMIPHRRTPVPPHLPALHIVRVHVVLIANDQFAVRDDRMAPRWRSDGLDAEPAPLAIRGR